MKHPSLGVSLYSELLFSSLDQRIPSETLDSGHTRSPMDNETCRLARRNTHGEERIPNGDAGRSPKAERLNLISTELRKAVRTGLKPSKCESIACFCSFRTCQCRRDIIAYRPVPGCCRVWPLSEIRICFTVSRLPTISQPSSIFRASQLRKSELVLLPDLDSKLTVWLKIGQMSPKMPIWITARHPPHYFYSPPFAPIFYKRRPIWHAFSPHHLP